MYLTVQGMSNQQTFKLVQWKDTNWYWNNNLWEYSDEEYSNRKCYDTKELAISFAKKWARDSHDVIKWVQLDGVTIKEAL